MSSSNSGDNNTKKTIIEESPSSAPSSFTAGLLTESYYRYRAAWSSTGGGSSWSSYSNSEQEQQEQPLQGMPERAAATGRSLSAPESSTAATTATTEQQQQPASSSPDDTTPNNKSRIMAGALRPPGELGRVMSQDMDAAGNNNNSTTPLHPLTAAARQLAVESTQRCQAAERAAAVRYHHHDHHHSHHHHHYNKPGTTDQNDDLITMLCYRGMEVVFCVTNKKQQRQQVALGLCARTHVVFQTLHLSSTAPVVALQSNAQTGQVCIIHADGRLQTYLPQAVQPDGGGGAAADDVVVAAQVQSSLSSAAGSFAWWNGPYYPTISSIFYNDNSPMSAATATNDNEHQTFLFSNTTTKQQRHINNRRHGRRHLEVSLSHNCKILLAHGDQLAVLDASAVPAPVAETVPQLLPGDNETDNDDDELLLQAELLWTTRLPAPVVTAQLSGNACAIAVVLQRDKKKRTNNNNSDDDDDADADGVHTFERDWNDGSQHQHDSLESSQHQPNSRPMSQRSNSVVGIVYQPGPFLVHAAPVTRLSFRGLGHQTARAAARRRVHHHHHVVDPNHENVLEDDDDDYDDEDHPDAARYQNDLLLTYSQSTGTARIFGSRLWNPVTEWTTPEHSRVDWVQGISAMTLGDLGLATTAGSSSKAAAANNNNTMRRSDSNTSLHSDGAAAAVGKTHVHHHHGAAAAAAAAAAVSSAGAWISELTFHGPFPAIRLSRLVYLKRGMDQARPTLLETVSSYLPAASLYHRAVISSSDYPHPLQAAAVTIQGIWPAWNPQRSNTRSGVDATSGGDVVGLNETVRGSAMSWLGLANTTAGNEGGFLGHPAALGNIGSIGGDARTSPPSELRLAVSHPAAGQVTLLECRLFGENNNRQQSSSGSGSLLELECIRRCHLSVKDVAAAAAMSSAATSVVESLAPSRPQPVVSASVQHEASRLVATVVPAAPSTATAAAGEERSIDVVWRRPGTSCILPSSWMPDDVERTGELLASASIFCDESLLPVPLAIPAPLELPKTIPGSIVQVHWWRQDHFDGPSLLLAVTSTGAIVVFEVPPPNSFSETNMPNRFMNGGSVFNDDEDTTMSIPSELRGASSSSGRPDYDVAIVPDPDHGLGLRLESQPDDSCVIAGSYKKHPLTGGMLPAEKTGMITLGDELIRANGVNLEYKTFDEIIATVRDVGATCGPGNPMQLRFRPAVPTLRRPSSSGAGLSSSGAGPQQAPLTGSLSLGSSRRSMEQILGVTPEDVDDSMVDTASRGGASSSQLVGLPLGELDDLDVQSNGNMIVGMFPDALPPSALVRLTGDEDSNDNKLVLIPLPAPPPNNTKTDPRQRDALVCFVEGRNIGVSMVSIAANCDVKGAKLTKIKSFAAPSGQDTDLRSIHCFGFAPGGFHLAVTDSNGDVMVGFASLADSADGIPVVSFQSFMGFHVSQPEYRLVGFSSRLLATMSRDDATSISVWSGTPQPVFLSNGNASNEPSDGSVGEFVSTELFIDDTLSGNRIVDFCFLSPGYLDESPSIVVFTLRGAAIYCKPASTEEWLPVVRVMYGGVSGSDASIIHNKLEFSSSFSDLGVRRPFDAFPHLVTVMRSLYKSSDEHNFLCSDWHPDSLLATICLDEQGAGTTLQNQARRVFMWLHSQSEDTDETDILGGSIVCAPMNEIYISNGKQGEENVPASAAFSGWGRGDRGTRNDDPLRAVQELLHKRFSDETESNAFSIGRRRASLDLPPVFRSLSREDARLMWIVGELIANPPDFRSLDSCGQRFLFAAALVRKAVATVVEKTKKEDHAGLTAHFIKRSQSMTSDVSTTRCPVQIASGGCLSAMLSGNQTVLVDRCREPGEKFDWNRVRELRVAFWLRSDSDLAVLSEEIGQTIFRNDKDIMECALFFLIAGKIRTLRNLAAADHTLTGRKFFKFLTSYDFSSDRGRLAASKNAFSLLRKCKYRVATAFFLLAGPQSLTPALETIVTKLEDVDLAFFVMRLIKSPVLNIDPAVGKGNVKSGLGGILGGGGGYAAAASTEDVPASNESSFSEWKPNLAVSTKNLIVDRVLPNIADDPVLTSTLLLWLDRREEASWCLSNTVKLSFAADAKFVPLNDATAVAFGKGESVDLREDGGEDASLVRANRFISFVSGPIILKTLGASARPCLASSLAVGGALTARGIELPAMLSLLLPAESQIPSVATGKDEEEKKACTEEMTGESTPGLKNSVASNAAPDAMQSSIFDSFEAPKKPPATSSGTMQSSIFDSFDAPKPPVKKQPEASASGAMQSSIFDSFDAPRPPVKKQPEAASSGGMESSIFDSFDAPRPPVKKQPEAASSGGMESSIFDSFDAPRPVKQQANVAPSGAMTSSIFDSFDGPGTTNVTSAPSVSGSTQSASQDQKNDSPSRPAEKESELPVRIDARPVPRLWSLWKIEVLSIAAAKRLLREISLILDEYHGDPPEIPIEEFMQRDVFVPPGVSGVLQVNCDGPTLLDTVQQLLESFAAFGVPDPGLIASHAVRMLGKSNNRRLLFAVVLYLVVGREDLAEKALRAAAKSLVDRCLAFTFSHDSIQYGRRTRSHASTQFLRRESARLSWQLESCLWLSRGGILPLSNLARKEAIAAVKVGLLITSWNRSFECLGALVETKPDCPVDDVAGRHLWSSLEGPKTERPDSQPKGASGGGWEFLVDCKRSQATEMLRHRPTGCFIIRPHSRDPGVFTLSFKTNLVPTASPEKDSTGDKGSENSGDERSDNEAAKPARQSATRTVKSSDVVQHAIVRLADSGFRCGSFGPFASLMSLLEAVSSSLPFKLRFDKPPVSTVLQEDGSQTSPNAVLLRKLALRNAGSITSNPPDVLQAPKDTKVNGMARTDSGGQIQPGRSFPRDGRTSFALFVELLFLSLFRQQLCGIMSVYDDDDETPFRSGVDKNGTDEEKEDFVEVLSEDNASEVNADQQLNSSRILAPLLTWCRSMEVRTVSKLAPGHASLSRDLPRSSVDVTESVDAIEVSTFESERGSGSFGNGGDAVLRRLIQQGSGIEFTTLRLVNGGECTMVLLFSRNDALKWLVEKGLEQSELSAEARLQKMQHERFIEPVDLSRLPLKQKSGSPEDGEVRFRFVDPWEVEALRSREGETQSATLGRCSLLSFSLGKVLLASESVLRDLGGLPLLELWTALKGGVALTKALASVYPPWERDAGGDLIDTDDNSTEASPYLNSIRQSLYRAALFRRLGLPQRFVPLIQVELLDLKNLTSPGGSLALNVYAILRLKRGASGAALTNKSRSLDSATTQPIKLSKSSGPNAPASWGSVVRFRFPLPEDVSVDGASPDKDREILFRGPPSFLQVSVYEKKLLVDHSLGAADVSMDGLWAGGQLEEWVPLRSGKHNSITWFARIRLTLRYELMCISTGGVESKDLSTTAPSVGLQRIEELSRAGGAAHEDMEKRSMSSPDLLSYFESMVY